MKRLVLILAIAATQAAVSPAATLALNPLDGAVAGRPGETVGWAYQFTAGPGEFDILTFSLLLIDDGFGAYQDYLLLPQNFEVIPAGGVSQKGAVFNPATGSGAGEFDIFPAAPPGPLSGTLLVFYDAYLEDPSTGASASSSGNFLAQDVSINILAPEPSLCGPITLLLIAAVARARYRLRRR